MSSRTRLAPPAPRPAGGYFLSPEGPTTVFILGRRPSRWNRFWVRFFLGWTWRDAGK